MGGLQGGKVEKSEEAKARAYGTIRNILPVRLPRPRDRSDREFVRVRKSIHHELLAPGGMAHLAPDNF
jgi:hypothetical protein